MSTPPTAQKVWYNGKFIDWNDANIHVMSHVIHYASSVFEGIRCYQTPQGPAVFRLREHIRRLRDSCHIYRMDPPFSIDELVEASIETVRVNGFSECYLRPVIFRGYGTFGVNPLPNPIEVYIASWVWGKYLGQEAIEKGVDVCTASWARMSPNTLPATAKSAANYMNSQLIKMEAITNGFVEGVALDASGNVSEGSGENLFMIRDGQIITPPLSSAILAGITRDSVMQIARGLGYEVKEAVIPRAALYIADEIFFTGTAAEITPIRSIDRIQVGSGERGPITAELQKEFFAITSGEKEAPGDWLSFVNGRK
ncbi:MAG: branched-chain amino acid transaminase [Acidobacteria bacterium]|nr:branched-chain amino acid transaminase [Acidobacteriota bacterium]MCW5968740.1 branched-chain amino acid transaminase [Blastocatellales bacterium]